MMLEGKWYCLSNSGEAELCFNQDDAENVAEDNDRCFPKRGPHRAVQLVDASEIERFVAEKSMKQAKMIEALRGFANIAIDSVSEGLGASTEEIREAAISHGLLVVESVTARCGDVCVCADTVGFDTKVRCYRKAGALE